MEKAFCVLDSKINPVIARYHTLHKDVELIVLNKKYDWPNRAREEVQRCPKCHFLILPKELKVHKALCKSKKETQSEVDNTRVGSDGSTVMG